MKSNENKNKNKNKLLILGGLILGILVVSMIGMFLMPSGGAKVKVTIDSKVYGTYKLSEDQTVTITSPYGTNVMEIKNGEVSVIESDCDNQICVNTIAMSAEQTLPIVCLPHGVVIEMIE